MFHVKQFGGPVIHVDGLRKEFRLAEKQAGFSGTLKALFNPTYKVVEAVKGVSFSIQQGEFVGFLGPNGAGKTTTIKILTGILYPSGGTALVHGHVPFDRKPEMLQQIALVMGNRQQLWWDLPAQESFTLLKEIYGIPESDYKQRLDLLVGPLQLEEKLTTQVRKLSLGERMKCELVAALLHRPSVVFLDEPTIGLDLTSQRNIRSFLKEYHRETGATIVLTSHYMQDVEELCERVIVINHGTLVYDGTLTALSAEMSGQRRLRITSTAQDFDFTPYGNVISQVDGVTEIEVASADVADITAKLFAQIPISDLAIDEPGLEETIEKVFSTPAQPQ